MLKNLMEKRKNMLRGEKQFHPSDEHCKNVNGNTRN